MDLVQATGGPEHFPLGGQPFPVRILTFKEWGIFQAWLRSKWPSPLVRALEALEQIRVEGRQIGHDAEELMLGHAQQASLDWPPRFGSPQWVDLVDRTEDAATELLYHLISKTVPGFDRQAAVELAGKATSAEIWDALRWAIWGIRPVPLSPSAGTATVNASAPGA